ncbi:hypothetical protein N0V86_007368 [Didymella sp. IMI 355093]|nr:hypothetical protein N0V86_007368 [Didymella sp. IMI 355093]
MSTNATLALFAYWKEEQILDELVHAGLLLSEIASASSVDCDEHIVKQYIVENNLEPVEWPGYNDDIIRNLWKEKSTREISHSLIHQSRSEIAVCIRAYQLKLRHTPSKRSGSKFDGYRYMVGKKGGWTSTGDSYVLNGVAAELTDEDIQYKFFRNTRTAEAVRKRRIELLKRQLSASLDPSASTSATPAQFTSTSQPDRTWQSGWSTTEVYEQMMIFHTNLSANNRDRVLGIMNRIGWPTIAQGDVEKGIGSWSGPQFIWTDADNELLLTLHKDYDLTWKEIADTFFFDRFEEELELQYGRLSQGNNVDDSIELD